MRPLQEIFCTSPRVGTGGDQVFTTRPSVALTRSTVTEVGAAPDTRYKNVTAGRASTYAFVRLVPVSRTGAPATCGPGTGVSSGFGVADGGGRIAIGGVGLERRPSRLIAVSGPVTAPTGTRAARRASLSERTLTSASSRAPRLPRNTTSVTVSRPVPVILSVLPARARLPEAHPRRQVTFVTFGFVT